MTRVSFIAGLVLGAALAAAGCSDTFAPPPLPDLYKEPYDFAVEVPPYTGPGADMAVTPRDLASPTD